MTLMSSENKYLVSSIDFNLDSPINVDARPNLHLEIFLFTICLIIIMSELAISSTNWLAISLRNGAAIVVNLNSPEQFECLRFDEINQQQAKENNEDDLNRNLIQFTPNGEKLIINGQNKQIYIYIQSNSTSWKLQRTITVKKRASALDSTNDYLFIADKSGDAYQASLSNGQDTVLTDDDCLLGHLSMLLDVKYFQAKSTGEKFLITADRDEKIRLSHYPNGYNIQGYCLGHKEFVSHVKLLDHDRIISASGDGTLRLWQLPDCTELNVITTKSLIETAKEIFHESECSYSEPNSSSMNESIWKMDASNNLIALSIYAYREHSIYVTNLSNNNQTRKITFDSKYGTIIDYTFSSFDLYLLFDSNRLFKLNLADEKVLIEEIDLKINSSHIMNNIHTLEIIFKQLFKTRGQPGDCEYFKRKNERIEQQEAKKQRKNKTQTS